MEPRSCSHLNLCLRTALRRNVWVDIAQGNTQAEPPATSLTALWRPILDKPGTRPEEHAGFCHSQQHQQPRHHPRGGSGRHGHEERNARGGSFRAISSARLCASLHLHLRPINVVVCDGPRGDLILRTASCLDAFSAYPFPTWLPSGAPGGTTGGPEVGPARSSRTSASTAQISNAHDR